MKKNLLIFLSLFMIATLFVGCSHSADGDEIYHPIRQTYTGTITSISTNNDGEKVFTIDCEPEKVFTDVYNKCNVNVGDNITIEVEESYNKDGFNEYRPIIEFSKN